MDMTSGIVTHITVILPREQSDATITRLTGHILDRRCPILTNLDPQLLHRVRHKVLALALMRRSLLWLHRPGPLSIAYRTDFASATVSTTKLGTLCYEYNTSFRQITMTLILGWSGVGLAELSWADYMHTNAYMRRSFTVLLATSWYSSRIISSYPDPLPA